MLTCPECNITLEKGGYNINQYWECPSCGGRAISMDVIEKTISPAFVKELWHLESIGTKTNDSRCAICSKSATRVMLNEENRSKGALICRNCRFVWFEQEEFEYLSRITPEPDVSFKLHHDGTVSSTSSHARVVNRDQLAREEFERQYDYGGAIDDSPNRWWHYVLSFLGFPAVSGAKTDELPVGTWSLAVIMAIVALMTFPNLNAVIQNWGLIPAEHTRHFGLTYISAFFLHGGIMHLVGNLYFLLMFGRRVEGVLYIDRYLTLFVLSALVGNVAHVIFDPQSFRPIIGASGGISGILAYYCLSFPKAEVRIFLLFSWIRISVVWFFFFWILWQSIGALGQVSGFGSVSFLAHLGGSIVGFVFWYIIVRPKRLKQAKWQ